MFKRFLNKYKSKRKVKRLERKEVACLMMITKNDWRKNRTPLEMYHDIVEDLKDAKTELASL